jgi:hypothetical protein
MGFNRYLSRIIIWLILFPTSQVGLATNLLGGEVGLSVVAGSGIADINRRLGDSRILNVNSKHGLATQAGLSWLKMLDKYPIVLQATLLMSRDSANAKGLAAIVESSLLQTGLEFSVMRDVMDLKVVRRFATRIGLSISDVDFALGLNTGISQLNHALYLTSKIDSSSVSYDLNQIRPHAGVQMLFGYRLARQYFIHFNLKNLYTWPTDIELKVRQFIVSGKDVSSLAKESGVKNLAPGYFLQNSMLVGLRYMLE